NNSEIQGYTTIKGGWNKGKAYTVYFHAVIDTPSDEYGSWKSGKKYKHQKEQLDSGEKTGAFFSYKVKKDQEIKVKVGISFLSIEKARTNLEKENNHWDFEKTKSNAETEWNKKLSKIEISETSEDIKKMFYTALYHSFLQPVKRTGEMKNWKPDEEYYDDFYAIWDTFRTLHPLLILVDTKTQIEIINSLINIYEKEGYMPEGRSGNDNGLTQGGSNADLVIADAFVKGVKGINYELAYQAMIKNAEVVPAKARKEGRGGLEDYNTLGYVSISNERAGTRTVEYANCDWGIAQVAKGLGKEDDYLKYRSRASNWKNLWRPVENHGATGFIWPKNKQGEWVEDFSVFKRGTWHNFFYESISWEYSLYVPQDIKELIKLSGGNEAFVKRLDIFFERDYYIVDNEPGFLSPNLYTWAGRYDKSAKMIHKIITENYYSGRGGLPGNDDSGSMSSWFAFQAMGIFPNAGQNMYLIGSPIIGNSKIKMDNGKTFEIKAHNLSDKNIYVSKATLNGKPLLQAWFKHTDIIDNGILELYMSNTPNAWGNKNPPPSMSDKN
ncbi:MAG: glycoside hydrolase family 92 protein, partial [Bacteroidetes bacterium]